MSRILFHRQISSNSSQNSVYVISIPSKHKLKGAYKEWGLIRSIEGNNFFYTFKNMFRLMLNIVLYIFLEDLIVKICGKAVELISRLFSARLAGNPALRYRDSG